MRPSCVWLSSDFIIISHKLKIIIQIGIIPNIFKKYSRKRRDDINPYYYYRLELGNIQFENTIWDTYMTSWWTMLKQTRVRD